MRAVVQRISRASVHVDGRTLASIDAGLLVYLAVTRGDTDADVDHVVEKVRNLRIFPDEAGRMNLDVGSVGGAVLVVSAFTVAGDVRRGRRPSFDLAASPEEAQRLYESFCEKLAAAGVRVARGSFGALMDVESVNVGPGCLLLDSRRIF
jgi:D-tyrosyl-tRNA(Tyr) deacylase